VDKQVFELGGRQSSYSRKAISDSILKILFDTISYRVFVRDSATGERVKLIVSMEEYAGLRLGASFAQTAHTGRLGIHYRWAWE
jgi:hypothetical protein